MGIRGVAPRPFLKVSLLTPQAFGVFLLEDAHTSGGGAVGGLRQRSHDLAIIQPVRNLLQFPEAWWWGVVQAASGAQAC